VLGRDRLFAKFLFGLRRGSVLFGAGNRSLRSFDRRGAELLASFAQPCLRRPDLGMRERGQLGRVGLAGDQRSDMRRRDGRAASGCPTAVDEALAARVALSDKRAP
jgi:hypothetical protein